MFLVLLITEISTWRDFQRKILENIKNALAQADHSPIHFRNPKIQGVRKLLNTIVSIEISRTLVVMVHVIRSRKESQKNLWSNLEKNLEKKDRKESRHKISKKNLEGSNGSRHK